MIDKQSLARNCPICGDRGKALKFVAVAEIREFYPAITAKNLRL